MFETIKVKQSIQRGGITKMKTRTIHNKLVAVLIAFALMLSGLTVAFASVDTAEARTRMLSYAEQLGRDDLIGLDHGPYEGINYKLNAVRLDRGINNDFHYDFGNRYLHYTGKKIKTKFSVWIEDYKIPASGYKLTTYFQKGKKWVKTKTVKKAGTYKVVVKGKKPYKGTLSMKFWVLPKKYSKVHWSTKHKHVYKTRYEWTEIQTYMTCDGKVFMNENPSKASAMKSKYLSTLPGCHGNQCTWEWQTQKYTKNGKFCVRCGG